MKKKIIIIILVFFGFFLGSFISGQEILILRPDTAGDECNITDQIGCSACPDHYTCVDDIIPDESTTIVHSDTIGVQRDLYNLPDPVGIGIVNKVTLYYRGQTSHETSSPFAGAIKTNGVVYETIWRSSEDIFTTFSEIYTENPQTENAWTWTEINNLQAGCKGRRDTGEGFDITQVYVEVDYYIPTPFSFVVITTDIVTSTLAYVGKAVSGLEPFLFMIIGIPFAFVVIKKVINLIPKK